jgi:L-rhamnose mutarotase
LRHVDRIDGALRSDGLTEAKGTRYGPPVTTETDGGRRICFVLEVRRDKIEEYTARHATVWPEMRQALSEAGWRNYSLFLRGDGLLIGYLECSDFEAAQARMQDTEVNTRWQAEMAPFFDLAGAAPDASMQPLAEIFHLD